MKPDKGIWEFRSEDLHFTFSKVLCWVAIDRAIKIAKIVEKKMLKNGIQLKLQLKKILKPMRGMRK